MYYQLFTKRQNFRSFQTESISRLQHKCNPKTEFCFEKGRRHCGKKRKCWLPAFSPFPIMFAKVFFVRAVKNRDCMIKS